MNAAPWSSVGLKTGISARFSTSLCFPRLWEAGSKRGKEPTTCTVLSPLPFPIPLNARARGVIYGPRRELPCLAQGSPGEVLLPLAAAFVLLQGGEWDADTAEEPSEDRAGFVSPSASPGLALLQDQCNSLLMLQFQARGYRKQGGKAFACSKCTKPRREPEQAVGRHKRKT